MRNLITLCSILGFFLATAQTTPGKYTIKNVEINTKYSDFGTAFFGKDKIVFASPKDDAVITRTTWSVNNQAFLDIYLASIDKNGQLTGKKPVPGDVNNKYHEGVVAFTKDLKTVYFDANNYNEKGKAKKDSTGMVNIQLYKADVTKNGEWHNIVKLPFNNDEFSTGHPALSLDDKKLYFVSDRPGSLGKTDIFVVDIYEDGTYGYPKNMGDRINTPEREMFPFVSDENILYFSSDGHQGHGGLDVFASRIFDTTVSESLNLEDPVNSIADDFAYIIDDINHEGYFSSNRTGGKGDDDIYHFVAFPPLRIEGHQAIAGIITDKMTALEIPGATVVLEDENGNEIKRITLPEGESEFLPYTNDPDQAQTSEIIVGNGKASDIQITKTVDNESPNPGHIVEFTLDISNIGKTDVEGIRVSDILPPGYEYVSDDSSNGEYVKTNDEVKIDNLRSGNNQTIKIKAKVTPSAIENTFQFDANSNTKYKIKVTAPGYIPYESEVRTANDTDIPPLEIKMELDQELRVEDEKIVININTIYFDFNKSNIRPDAAKELDKVIAVMKQHPSMVIEAGSHTDSRASDGYNIRLSNRRAKSTVDYIVAGGVARDRIKWRGYGETQLVNNCSNGVKCSREEHQLNRRTEFVIVNDNERIASIDKTAETVISDPNSPDEMGVDQTRKVQDEQVVAEAKQEIDKTVPEREVENATAGAQQEGKVEISAPVVRQPVAKAGDRFSGSVLKNTADHYIEIPPVYYPYDSWGITDSEFAYLDKVIQLLKENPALIVEAGVHTDTKNLELYNLLLSQKRAKTVVDYIISKGISPNRIYGKGYGEEGIVNKCKNLVKCTDDEHQLNRRIEFMVIDGNGYPSPDFIEKDGSTYLNTNPIYFDHNSAEIRKDAAYELDRAADIMLANPAMSIEIEGHTDAQNVESYNKALSISMAEAAKKYLVSKGVNEANIAFSGFGEKRLVNNCTSFVKCTPVQQQANRRVEIKIVNK